MLESPPICLIGKEAEMAISIIGSYAKALVMTTDHIPFEGETLMGQDYREEYGGKGSDMAVQAARLGATTHYIGVVGDDSFGKEFSSLMNTEGVDVKGLRISKSAPTGVGFIIKDTNARNVIVVDAGANGEFSNADIDSTTSIIAETDIALTQLEIPLTTALYGMHVARKHGVKTVLNPAPAVNLRGVDLRDIDIITPNETEARVCVGLSPTDPIKDQDVAHILLEQGVQAVVMTLGSKGAAIFTPELTEFMKPFPINAVDSNGAGDSFNAGLCVALSEGKNLVEAARFASAVAAMCCTKWETVPSYHTRQQVNDFIENQT